MEHHKRVSTNAPPQGEGHFVVGFMCRAHMLDRIVPYFVSRSWICDSAIFSAADHFVNKDLP